MIDDRFMTIGRAIGAWTALMLTVSAMSAGFATPAAAQDRAGFWIGAGAGLGTAGIAIDTLGDARDTVGVFHVDAGWTLSRHVLLGLRIDSLGITIVHPASAFDERTAIVDLLGTITVYPRASSGFFVRGGAGPSFIDDTDDSAGTLEIRGRGLSVMAGAGYDVSLGRRFSLTPAVSYRYGRVNGLTVNQRFDLGGWRHDVLAITASLTLK